MWKCEAYKIMELPVALNEDVLPSMLKYVPDKELIQLRLVSKTWNAGVLHELKKRKWTLKIPRWPYDVQNNKYLDLERIAESLPDTFLVNQEWDLGRIDYISEGTSVVASMYLPLLMQTEHVVINKPFDMKYADWDKLSSKDWIYAHMLRRLEKNSRLKSITLVSGKPSRFDAIRDSWRKYECAEYGAVLNVDFGVGGRNVEWAVKEVSIREFNGFLVSHVVPVDRSVLYTHWIENCVINMPTKDEGDIPPYQWIGRVRRLAKSELHIVRLIITCSGFLVLSKGSLESLLKALADVVMATSSSLKSLTVPTLAFLDDHIFPRLLELDLSEEDSFKINPEGASVETVKFLTSLWGVSRLYTKRPLNKVFPVLQSLRLNHALLHSFLQKLVDISSPLHSVQLVISTGPEHGDINLEDFSVQFPNGFFKHV